MSPLSASRRTRPRHGLPDFDWGIVLPVWGWTLLAVGIGLVAALATAIVHADGADAIAAFGLTATVVLPIAVAMLWASRLISPGVLRPRDGFFAVTMAWVLAAVVGMAPFLIGGTMTSPVEALFESMSGFTTTGATVIDDIEAQAASVLLWRSISQWIGGIGIVVLVVGIAPATGMATQRIFEAEATGVEAHRFTPRIADTAKIIISIYLALSVACLAAYLVAGMGPFDAVNHVFTTVATAGFSTKNASIAAFDSLAIEIVAMTFMVLGAINFAFYWRAVTGRGAIWPQIVEIRTFLGILAGAIAAATIALVLMNDGPAFGEALRGAAFSVITVGTTTGYTTADFDQWTDFGRILLLLLMFIGGCAGSTAGGMKVMRVLLLARICVQEVKRQLQPTAVQVIKVGRRPFDEAVRVGVLGFVAIYLLAYALGALAVAATGVEFVGAFSATASALNLIGPAFAEVGPVENFRSIPDAGLGVLIFLMLVGRLEVFTVVVLLVPLFWRRRGHV